MKNRKPIPRFTSLKPGKTSLKRTRLRAVSKKSAKAQRSVREERKAYRERYGVCPLCGEHQAATIHECIGGRYRQRTVLDKRFWIACCWSCHGEFLQHAKLTWQLCIKALIDAENYSLDAIRELYASDGREPEVVCEDEVQAVKEDVLRLWPNLTKWSKSC